VRRSIRLLEFQQGLEPGIAGERACGRRSSRARILGGTLAYQYDRKFALWWIPVAILLVLAFASISPTRKLRGTPPTGFADSQAGWDARRQASEEQVARAYWECAVGVVQWRFAYGASLPEDPPPEFTLSSSNLPSGTTVSPDARKRYWGKLRKAWALPEVWEKSYVWNPNMSFSAFKSFLERIFSPGGGESVQSR